MWLMPLLHAFVAAAAAAFAVPPTICTVTPGRCVADDVIPCPSCPNHYHRLRVLGEPIIQPQPAAAMSPELCARLCFDRQLPLAGVEAGTECMCGREVDSRAEVLSGAGVCAAPCAGNRSEHCGARFQLHVFNVSCSGTPRPPPPLPGPPPGPPPPAAGCLNPAFAKQRWCNAALPIDERVSDMISRMTLSEKIVSLGSSKNAIPSLGLPSYNWRSEANNGLDYYNSKSKLTPHATRTAYPCTTAMAFNRSLFHALGAQVGAEARAMANVGSAAGTWWHPVINLGRDPRWGRSVARVLSPPSSPRPSCVMFGLNFDDIV
jgi:beta-D-xylosidase 4